MRNAAIMIGITLIVIFLSISQLLNRPSGRIVQPMITDIIQLPLEYLLGGYCNYYHTFDFGGNTESIDIVHSPSRREPIFAHATPYFGSTYSSRAEVQGAGRDGIIGTSDDTYSARPMTSGLAWPYVRMAARGPEEAIVYPALSNPADPDSPRDLVVVTGGFDNIVGTNDDKTLSIRLRAQPPANRFDETYQAVVAIGRDGNTRAIWQDDRPNEVYIIDMTDVYNRGTARTTLVVPPHQLLDATDDGIIWTGVWPSQQYDNGFRYTGTDVGLGFNKIGGNPQIILDAVYWRGWNDVAISFTNTATAYVTGPVNNRNIAPQEVYVYATPSGRVDNSAYRTLVYTAADAGLPGIQIRDVALIDIQPPLQALAVLLVPQNFYFLSPTAVAFVYNNNGVWGDGDDVKLPPQFTGTLGESIHRGTFMGGAYSVVNGRNIVQAIFMGYPVTNYVACS